MFYDHGQWLFSLTFKDDVCCLSSVPLPMTPLKCLLFQLSSDGINVRRSAPLSDTGPVDERTLYVVSSLVLLCRRYFGAPLLGLIRSFLQENIPNHADHEWLKSKFSVFGAVQYVSLPRFKALNAIKGFAFIEFDSPDAVQKAEQVKRC